MKTIGINNEIKAKLQDEMMENESMNDLIKRLMDSCDDIEPYVPLERCNIHIAEDTFERLQSFRQSPKESYGSVITRLLNSQKCNSDD